MPAALWTGAIAPVFTHTTIYQDVSVPGWSDFPFYTLWLEPENLYVVHDEVRTEAGVFASTVGLNQLGTLAETAKTATPSTYAAGEA